MKRRAHEVYGFGQRFPTHRAGAAAIFARVVLLVAVAGAAAVWAAS